MIRNSLSFIFFIILAFVAYLLFNSLTFESKQINYAPAQKIEISGSAAIHLAEAIRIPTISHASPIDFDSAQFFAFNDFLKATYPLVHAHLQKTVVNEMSFLYKWQGANDALPPAVLTAHIDVVPVAEEDLDKWTFPPFDGVINDGVIWGRGALDDKVSVIGILEAVEYLIREDFIPQRSVYLAFGHDEEIGGLNGANAIAGHLESMGIRPSFVLDEGLSITQGLVPGVLTDVALIGIAEKGFVSLTLRVEIDGGHASMPAHESAIQLIAKAITKHQSNPFPARITEPVSLFLDHVGPEMRFQEKLVFANRRLFTPVILNIYQQSPPGRAVVTTTMAPTIIKGGVKDNVVPAMATATINFRILPGTSIAEVMEHVISTIDDDRVTVESGAFLSEPGNVSGIASEGYSIVNRSIKEVFPEVITAPNLVIAATDGRHYGNICDDIYRFIPIRLNTDNINTMHGINERLPVEDFKDAIRFYIQLIRNCG